MPKQEIKPNVPAKEQCADCSRLIAALETRLNAFVTFLCAPLAKCQRCGLLATRLTTVVHPMMGRSEHLCCEICEPRAALEGAKLEHAPIGDVDRAKEINAIVSAARRDVANGG